MTGRLGGQVFRAALILAPCLLGLAVLALCALRRKNPSGREFPVPLDEIPMAVALFNGKREMLYRNRSMEEFLLVYGLDRADPRLLERIAGGGDGKTGALDPGARAVFDSG
ncbi:MAG: hypothetical protein LBN92_06600, partial [Treponema sp.]|nr:hypothetical protein [Treponema sp.]